MASKEGMSLKKVALWGALLVFLTWGFSAIAILKIFPTTDEHGTFGDLFGAINALFSGLAFLGVIIAILLQKDELEEQRKEIKQSRIAQNKSAIALGKQSALSGLMAKLEAVNHILASLDRQITRVKNSGKYDATARIDELIVKQQKYENLAEKYLAEIELLGEDKHVDDE